MSSELNRQQKNKAGKKTSKKVVKAERTQKDEMVEQLRAIKDAKKAKKAARKPVANPFKNESGLDDDKVFIECPGATIYEPGTRNIIAGVRFYDEAEASKGFEIVANPVYAPEHRGRRMVRKKDMNCLRRCQACQDLTVRMVRREGPDFYIPNPKHPKKRQLRSIERDW